MSSPIGASGSASYSKSSSRTDSESRVVPTGWAQKGIEGVSRDYASLFGAPTIGHGRNRAPDPNYQGPFAGPNLGYDRHTLAMLPGGARDLAAGALEAGRQDIDDTYSMPGGPGVGSFAHRASLAGLRGRHTASVASAGRDAALADAAQRREDFDRRISVGQGLIGQGLGYATRKGTSRTVAREGSGSVSASYV